jgi:hypothetical protein
VTSNSRRCRPLGWPIVPRNRSAGAERAVDHRGEAPAPLLHRSRRAAAAVDGKHQHETRRCRSRLLRKQRDLPGQHPLAGIARALDRAAPLRLAQQVDAQRAPVAAIARLDEPDRRRLSAALAQGWRVADRLDAGIGRVELQHGDVGPPLLRRHLARRRQQADRAAQHLLVVVHPAAQVLGDLAHAELESRLRLALLLRIDHVPDGERGREREHGGGGDQQGP